MKFRIIALVSLCAIPVLSLASPESFSRTLRVGMRGNDVREMQKVLNVDVQTRVAETGAGSPGNETDYFGPATKRALVKFQEKYRSEVLAPFGLVRGTGVFGEKTREKARIILLGSVSTVSQKEKPPTATSATPPASSQSGDVIVMFPSQYSGTPGTMITISGAGFTSTDNTVYFGPGHAVVRATSWNGQDITLKVPQMPKGVYSLYVTNARGESNKDAFFVVTDGVTPEPKIESVAPLSVSRGENISIKGSGFTSNGNTIRAGLNVFESVSSSDGSLLSFFIPRETFATTTPPSAKKVTLPLWIYVINENGVSNGVSISLEI